MSFAYTVDERYLNGSSLGVGAFDAPSELTASLENSYALALSQTAYGSFQNYDYDFYALGNLSNGTYEISISSLNWDLTENASGELSRINFNIYEVAPYNFPGSNFSISTVAGVFGDIINFPSSYTLEEGTYWLQIAGEDAQYSLEITQLAGDLNLANEIPSARPDPVIERDDLTLFHSDFSPDSAGVIAAKFIGVAFGRDHLNDYFDAVMPLVNRGYSTADLSELVTRNGLIEDIAGRTDGDWVEHIYRNVTGEYPDEQAKDYYVNQLVLGQTSKVDLLTIASSLELVDAQIDLVGLKQNGLTFDAF